MAVDLEQALVRCASGDHTALNGIYAAEGARMLGIAMRILKRRPLAEDAVQDAFVLIWRDAAKFDAEKASAATWIYTVLRNRSLSILRDEGRSEPTDMPTGEHVVDEAVTPEQTITLTYVHGLSYGELAGKMGMPLGTIKSWLRCSLLTLRVCLQ
jgi:DNA-directed RNA polymerase specialized sigma24 family protein